MAYGKLVGLGLVVLLLASSRPAFANAAAPFSQPTGAAAGVVMERPSPLVVEREELVIDCASGQSSPLNARCSFKATYFLLNPTGSGEELLGAFYTLSRGGRGAGRPPTEDLSVRPSLDGAQAHAQANTEQLRRMDAIVAEDPEVARELQGGHGLDRTPFRVAVGAGARARLVFEGRLTPVRYRRDESSRGYALPAIVARHIFFAPSASRSWDRSEDEFFYMISPLSRWAGDPEVLITVRHRRDNDFVPRSLESAWTKSKEGDVEVETASVRASSRKNLRFGLSYTPFPLVNGGPLIGLGPRIGREELRVRAGYEFSGPSYLVYGLSAETNFREYMTAVASIDLATPNFIFLIPSLAVGAGVPVQLRKGEPTRVGGRMTLTISWPLVSFLFPVDYYPVANSSGSHFEGAFMTQLSF